MKVKRKNSNLKMINEMRENYVLSKFTRRAGKGNGSIVKRTTVVT